MMEHSHVGAVMDEGMKNKILPRCGRPWLARGMLAVFILLSVFSSINYALAPSIGLSDFSEILPVTVVSLMIGLGILVMVYYIGTMLGNPRVVAWAKSELVYMVMVALVVFFIIGVIDFFTSQAAVNLMCFGVYGGSAGTCTGGVDNIYATSFSYLGTVATDSMTAMHQLQYDIGVTNVRASLSSYGCKTDEAGVWPSSPFRCVMVFAGGSATSWSDYSGDYAKLSIYTMLLNTTTIALVNSIVMMLFLHYAWTTFVQFLLPAGLLIGAIPYMRKLGGVLISIAIGFLVLLPLIFSIIYFLWMPVYNAHPIEKDVLTLKGDLEPDWSHITNVLDWAWVPDTQYDIPGFINITAALFVSAVFMTYLALALTIAGIASISKTFGGDVDLSKMMQML